MLFGAEDAGPNKCYVYINTTGELITTYAAGGNAASFETNDALSNGQQEWQQLVLVADDSIAGVGGLIIYLDGVLQADNGGSVGDTSGVTFTDYVNANQMYIGARNNNSVLTNPFAGLLDEPTIFTKALSAAEVRDFYELSRWRYGV